MLARQEVIAHSIQHAIINSDKKPGFYGVVPGFFYFHWLPFQCVRRDLFDRLRNTWEIKDEGYLSSFRGPPGSRDALTSMGDMGKCHEDEMRACSSTDAFRLFWIDVLQDTGFRLSHQVYSQAFRIFFLQGRTSDAIR